VNFADNVMLVVSKPSIGSQCTGGLTSEVYLNLIVLSLQLFLLHHTYQFLC
jgi:hypothetical protein